MTMARAEKEEREKLYKTFLTFYGIKFLSSLCSLLNSLGFSLFRGERFEFSLLCVASISAWKLTYHIHERTREADEWGNFTTEKFKFHSFSIIHFIISHLIKFHSDNSWFASSSLNMWKSLTLYILQHNFIFAKILYVVKIASLSSVVTVRTSLTAWLNCERCCCCVCLLSWRKLDSFRTLAYAWELINEEFANSPLCAEGKFHTEPQPSRSVFGCFVTTQLSKRPRI